MRDFCSEPFDSYDQPSLSQMATLTISCKALTKPAESQVDFGAELHGLNIEQLTGKPLTGEMKRWLWLIA